MGGWVQKLIFLIKKIRVVGGDCLKEYNSNGFLEKMFSSL